MLGTCEGTTTRQGCGFLCTSTCSWASLLLFGSLAVGQVKVLKTAEKRQRQAGGRHRLSAPLFALIVCCPLWIIFSCHASKQRLYL